MITINVSIRGASARAVPDGILTAGMIGVGVHFTFDEAWDGLTRRGYARTAAGKYPIVLDADGYGIIPWECLTPGVLYLGVDGWEDDTVRIPTVWAMAGAVRESVADGTETEPIPPPSPSEVEQVIALAQSADEKANSALAAIKYIVENGVSGGLSPEAIAEAVADYLRKHPIDVPTKTSQLENDSGFLTEHQSLAGLQPKIADLETIREGARKGATALQPGDLAEWAKQQNKPKYTAAEVGAIPAGAQIPPDRSEDVDKLKEDLTQLSGRTETLETALIGVDAAITRLEAAV